jgi:hypothetical protein
MNYVVQSESNPVRHSINVSESNIVLKSFVYSPKQSTGEVIVRSITEQQKLR